MLMSSNGKPNNYPVISLEEENRRSDALRCLIEYLGIELSHDVYVEHGTINSCDDDPTDILDETGLTYFCIEQNGEVVVFHILTPLELINHNITEQIEQKKDERYSMLQYNSSTYFYNNRYEIGDYIFYEL